MAKDRRDEGTQDSDWLFAERDPHALPTERIPGRDEFDRYATPLLARPTEPAQPPRFGAPPQGDPYTMATPGSQSPARQHSDADGTGREQEAGRARFAYARSGTTPAGDGSESRRLVLPARFADLGTFDALRDIVALVCLIAAMSTTFTLGETVVLDIVGRAAVGLALAVLIAVALLRWIPKQPKLRPIRLVRVIGLLPALLVAVGTILADLVLSLPLLFAPLPEGPPVGLGAGVSLLLVGVLVGIEPRSHEGYLPANLARQRARSAILGIGIAAAVAFALSLVMLTGRIFTTGWPYSVLSIADALVSALLLLIVIGAAVRRERSWFVFSAGAVSGLVIGAIADNTLRLDFAAPLSFATGFVYLPFLFAAYAIMISRSFVRTMPISFRRVDWIVYAVRAFEFSAIMHAAAVGWNVVAAITAFSSDGPGGGPILHLLNALVAVSFVMISRFARRALLERPADQARASAVVAAIGMVVVGFLGVIVNSLATGAGAGLVNGGVALTIGVAAALMLTVPAPVRDEFGAPDLARMFEDFRLRDTGRATLLARVPDIDEESSRRKTFPAGTHDVNA